MVFGGNLEEETVETRPFLECTLAGEEPTSVLERERRDTLSGWNPPGSPVDESEANTEVKLHFAHYNSG